MNFTENSENKVIQIFFLLGFPRFLCQVTNFLVACLVCQSCSVPGNIFLSSLLEVCQSRGVPATAENCCGRVSRKDVDGDGSNYFVHI